MKVEEGFQIVPYDESHPYTKDTVLPQLLNRLLPHKYLSEIESDLTEFGDFIVHHCRNIGDKVAPPQITQFNHLGRRVDRLHTSEGWRELKDIAVREGIVAIPHERKQEEFSRIYGFTKVLLFAGDSHEVLCPMAMTDGVARVLELSGTEQMKREIRSRLISRDSSLAFTAGQWMSERPGGSDVSQTETKALSITSTSNSVESDKRGSLYLLDGFKWFSSATDSNISVALARTGPFASGSRSLSLFLVPLRLPLLPQPSPDPTSNGITIHRLKNKLGTHALPTAELSLNNTKAYLLSPLNEGVKTITPVLNITRLYSAFTSVGCLRRALDIARSYALVRQISIPGGQSPLKDVPLHMTVLADITITYQALTHFAFGIAALLGKSECGKATGNEEARLRLLTPVLKAFASEKAVSAMEDCMTCLGGLGYMEEVGIGRLIRDCLVEKIWEGTVNVLVLDMIRASNKTFTVFMESISCPKEQIQDLKLEESISAINHSLNTLKEAFKPPLISAPFVQRLLLFLLGHTTASIYLFEHVIWGYTEQGSEGHWEIDRNVFKRYVGTSLENLCIDLEKLMRIADRKSRSKDDTEIVYGIKPIASKL
ncbi:hypothetical protein Clacol_002243 [Clathrus columnatus]|uniref:Uncharacterized protein n=1 Tax=Clathrus columnatus TaxID=1419009 RepID=A0AAV5A4T5_9AGAM|nr:hypothetical protein Clacol_002243 [Clathrus columnatus]